MTSDAASAHLRLSQLKRAMEISRMLNSTLDLNTLLQIIVETACELTESEASSILLFDPEANELRFEAVPAPQRDVLRKLSVPLVGEHNWRQADTYSVAYNFLHESADFFHPLVRHIEDLVNSGKAAYPVERTLLTSGMTLAAVESLHRGQVPIETPEMEVRYQVDAASTFWRD